METQQGEAATIPETQPDPVAAIPLETQQATIPVETQAPQGLQAAIPVETQQAANPVETQQAAIPPETQVQQSLQAAIPAETQQGIPETEPDQAAIPMETQGSQAGVIVKSQDPDFIPGPEGPKDDSVVKELEEHLRAAATPQKSEKPSPATTSPSGSEDNSWRCDKRGQPLTPGALFSRYYRSIRSRGPRYTQWGGVH